MIQRQIWSFTTKNCAHFNKKRSCKKNSSVFNWNKNRYFVCQNVVRKVTLILRPMALIPEPKV